MCEHTWALGHQLSLRYAQTCALAHVLALVSRMLRTDTHGADHQIFQLREKVPQEKRQEG